MAHSRSPKDDLILDYYTIAGRPMLYVGADLLKCAIEEQLVEYWGGYYTTTSIIDASTLETVSQLKSSIQAIPLTQFDSSNVLLVIVRDGVQTNGHAFVYDGVGIAYYVLKTGYSLNFHRVFAIHEIIHAIHYRLSPTFSFNTVAWQQHTGRQLLCEGIATVCTSIVLGISLEEALWSDALSRSAVDSWMNACASSKQELCQIALDNFDVAQPSGMFQFIPDAMPIKNRSGYWLGASFIQHLLDTGMSAQEILIAPYSVLSEELKEWLISHVR